MASAARPMAFQRQVQLFRLGGVALYQSTIILIAMLLLGVLPSSSESPRSPPTKVACGMLLLVLQMLPSTILNFVQVTIEPQPLSLEKHLPRSWRVPPGTLLPLGRVLGRISRLSHLTRLLVLLAAYSLTGASFMGLHLWSRGYGHKSGAIRFGALLGATYALLLIARGLDTLEFPVLQRHRIFRIKKQKLEVVREAAVTVLAASGVQILLSLLGWGPWRGVWSSYPLALLASSFLCVFCFSTGRHVVQVISTEQLTFLPPLPDGHSQDLGATSNVQLYEALQNDKAEVLQTLALLQLCSIAETSGRQAERRHAIFADESGAAWQLPAKVCMREIETVIGVAAECLPQSKPKPADSATSMLQAPQWNQRPLRPKQGLAVPDRRQDVAAWAIRARYQRTQWAVRALAAFAAASRSEDSYGVLQSMDPGLGSVLQSLLSLVLVLRQHNKTTASTGSRRREEVTDPGMDGSARYAHALCDVALTATRMLADEFGEDLRRPLIGVSTRPAFSTLAELSSLLDTCYQGQARQ